MERIRISPAHGIGTVTADLAGRSSIRARSCRSPISSISTPPPALRSNSLNPRPSSSSTRIRAALAAKPNMRVVTASFGDRTRTRDVRTILGGWLVQAQDQVIEAGETWPAGDHPRVVTRRAPTPAEWDALRFAWRVCAHVKSNTVIFTGRDATIAVGAGQMSRVDAVKAAVMKGGDRLGGSVVASDAFFPFRDGLDAVAASGATAVAQPGGSVRDQEVIAAADEHDLAMVFTGRRHFRH